MLTSLTESFGSGASDILIIRLDPQGNILWKKVFGGTGYDSGSQILQTRDGGFLVSGSTTTWSVGRYDALLLKLDRNGNSQWLKTFGGPFIEGMETMRQTRDGGFILTGATGELDQGTADILVVRLDANGNIRWQKVFGSPKNDAARSIVETSNGGFILTGFTKSGTGNDVALILRLSPQGGIRWQKAYGGPSDYASSGNSIMETNDGGFILAGTTAHLASDPFSGLLLRLDAHGNFRWRKTVSGPRAGGRMCWEG